MPDIHPHSWENFASHVEQRAKDADARAANSDLLAEVSQLRLDLAQRSASKLRTLVAIAISVVALGCAAALFFSNKAQNEKADKNSCAINKFVDLQKTRTQQLKLKGSSKYVEEFNTLQNRLSPPISECDKILDK